jgi:hypothetical protein
VRQLKKASLCHKSAPPPKQMNPGKSAGYPECERPAAAESPHFKIRLDPPAPIPHAAGIVEIYW